MVGIENAHFSNCDALMDLSPYHLEYAAYHSPNQIAWQYGKRLMTWHECYTRCKQFASQLQHNHALDTLNIATLLPNVPAHFEAHFATQMLNRPLHQLVTTNTALELAEQLHAQQVNVLLVDPAHSQLVQHALSLCPANITVLDVEDEHYELYFSTGIGQAEYEDWLQEGHADFIWQDYCPVKHQFSYPWREIPLTHFGSYRCSRA